MGEKEWWIDYPWRMVQTNLREIDMEHINAKEYARELKEYNATIVTLNAAGILASYPTKLPFHKKSEYLSGDSLQSLIKACHEEDIKVIARCDFSKIPYEVYRDNEEWAYRDAEGNILNYNGYVQTCINGEYQQRYMFDILTELFETHDFDGLFCNMSGTMIVDYDYKVYGPCHCNSCKELFKEQMGGEIPVKMDPRDPMYGRYMGFIQKCAQMQKQKMYRTVKAINGNLAVNGFDYFRTECNQDMDRPTSIYAASTNARRITGVKKDKVCDNASTEFMGFRYRHTAISPAIMELRQWQNLANAGSTSVYIMGTLGEHKDQSGLLASKKAFDFFAKHEDLYQKVTSAAKVLLIDKPLMARVDMEVEGWIQALSEAHIPFDEVKQSEVTEEMLREKDLVILADVRFVTDEFAAFIDQYVKEGGCVLATGYSGTYDGLRKPRERYAFSTMGLGEILEKRIGLMSSVLEIADSERRVFTNCSKKECAYIVPGAEFVVPKVLDTETVKTYLTLVPEQKYGPPEICYPTEKTCIPGVYVNQAGAGKFVYVPWLMGSFYYEQGFDNTFSFMKDVLFALCGANSIAKDANPMCEFTIMEKEDGEKIIHVMNTSGCFGSRYFEPVPMVDIVIDPGMEHITEVNAYHGGTAEIMKNDGRDCIRLNRLNVYEVLSVK